MSQTNNHGGAREGAGRPAKSREEHIQAGTFRRDRHARLPAADEPSLPDDEIVRQYLEWCSKRVHGSHTVRETALAYCEFGIPTDFQTHEGVRALWAEFRDELSEVSLLCCAMCRLQGIYWHPGVKDKLP